MAVKIKEELEAATTDETKKAFPVAVEMSFLFTQPMD